MSSPSESFQCRWQGSRLLLTAYLTCLALALCTVWSSALSSHWAGPITLACIAHAGWVIPRRILLWHAHAVTGLRRDALGWQLYSAADGWQPVRLCRDSVALPQLIVLRYVRAGRWFGESQCIPRDALAPELHRRLRVRLKFSRRRWCSP